MNWFRKKQPQLVKPTQHKITLEFKSSENNSNKSVSMTNIVEYSLFQDIGGQPVHKFVALNGSARYYTESHFQQLISAKVEVI